VKRVINGVETEIFLDESDKECFINKKGDEVWLAETECLNCGGKIFGSHGGLSEKVPICDECQKTYKPIKRGNYKKGD